MKEGVGLNNNKDIWKNHEYYLPKKNKNKIHNIYNSMYKYTCIVLVNFSHLGCWFSLQEWKNTYKNPNTRQEKPSFELLARAIQKTPKTYSLLLLPLVISQR